MEQDSMEQAEHESKAEGMQSGNEADSAPASVERGQEEAEEQPGKRSSWTLVQCEEFTHDIKEYKRRRRKALEEALMDIREGQLHLSGRVISIWAYQRGERRCAS